MNAICQLPATQWDGCYQDGWQGEIVPDAFQHPAKVSRALIRRIYEHAIAEGWVKAGDTVVDPFGGIGGTALPAILNGINWTGCELEPKFHGLAEQNRDLWNNKYGGKAGFGRMVILQGDSRKLADVIGAAGMVVSSPPFLDARSGTTRSTATAKGGLCAERLDTISSGVGYGDTPGNLDAMKEGEPPALIVSSPPYADSIHDGNGIDTTKFAKPAGSNSQATNEGYGQTPGQLGRLKEGEAPVLVISSPPYAAIAVGSGGLNHLPGKDGQQSGRSADSASQQADSHYGGEDGQLSTMREGDAPACIISSPPFSHPNEQPVASQSRLIKEGGYDAMKGKGKMAIGASEGNLEGMPEGRFDALVSSPPYEGCPVIDNPRGVEGGASGGIGKQYREGNRPKGAGRKADGSYTESYGKTEGQIGQTEGDTFWQAAREIVAQCALILKPGGHAIWITKDFVRKGKRVPFSDQWQALCEQQGFRLVCRHQAMLVAHHGEQDDIFGETKKLKTERKSFFRRLAEGKGSPAIDWEDVICMVKL